MNIDRIPEITALISKIDTAMARADGVGKDAMRNLMPELREAIDEVNTALREVDSLLFQGLRDEAVGLHDEDFPLLAARLNLEDREEWPELEQFFVVSGVGFPPKIDFETLSALESAFSEIEALRRPLDRLRRMALERAPVGERLRVLRELRKADPTKPVWTQAIKDHEQARVAELLPEARRVLAMRDPQAIAALHAELTDPGWSVPIPKDLIRATGGADAWMNLRSAAGLAKEAGKGLEAAWLEVQEGRLTPELVDRLRRLRLQYDQAVRLAAESHGRLGDFPTVAGLVQEERLVEQVDSVAARVSQPLSWLSAQDAADAVAGQFQQLCGQLEYLCGQNPARTAESAWLAEVQRLQAEVGQICQSHTGLVIPSSLQERVAGATAVVLGRAQQRRKLAVAASVAGLVLAGLMVLGVAAWWRKGSVARVDLRELEYFSARARAGEFVEVPADVADLFGRYEGDERFANVASEITGFVRQEAERRDAFRESISAVDRSIEAALAQLEARQGDRRLDVWPDSVVEGARAWRRAREIGGEPGKRGPEETMPTATNAAVDELRVKEDRELASREVQQKAVESEYEKAAAACVKERKRELLAELPNAGDAVAIEALQQATNTLLESLKVQTREKKKIAPELLETTPFLRYPKELEEILETTQRMIEDKRKGLE